MLNVIKNIKDILGIKESFSEGVTFARTTEVMEWNIQI